MRVALALAALAFAALAFANSGCTCGSYSGGGDTVYARGSSSDQLILCENGGFSATVSDVIYEGKIVDVDDQSEGIIGSDGQAAFTIVGTTDDTLTADGLGSGEWTLYGEDEVSLDHANMLCEALETRAWWN